MAWSVGIVVYAVVQFIAFLLVLVATPIDMFRIRSSIATASPHQCLTLWGLKENCGTTVYNMSSDDLWLLCPPRHNRFRAAQALAVITILVYGAAFVLGVMMLFCCSFFRWVCVALNIVGAGTLCFVWAAMVVTYNKSEGPRCLVMEDVYTYGAGFVLLVLTWVLDVLNIAVLLFPCPDSGSGEMGKVMETKSQD
ncbi:Amastin surface glycoprotein, putative [Leishmania lindenbergi]|uniref:Amastin surface glycoprotein n=1 Tax=Leishmania lindenbergi TaxID=651832 RepID=A0AAW3AK92_9TRYP